MDTQNFKVYLSIKLGLTDSTTDAYIGKLAQFLQWIKRNNQILSAQSIENFLLSKKDSPNTINIYIYLFRHLEDYLRDKGQPVDLIKGFKTRKIERPPIQILTVDEVKRLLNTTIIYKKQNYLLVLNGVPIELVGQILGHEDIGLTMNTYVHLKNEQLQQAMFKMPYYRENINPTEIIKHIISVIQGFKLQDDERFDFKLLQDNDLVEFKLVIT